MCSQVCFAVAISLALNPVARDEKCDVQFGNWVVDAGSERNAHVRPPKLGEHLGEYLLANLLPPHSPARELPVPRTSIPLPPHEERREFEFGFGGGRRRGPPPPPKLGDLPPKPGQNFGEYAIASELPPRYPALELKLPALTAPPVVKPAEELLWGSFTRFGSDATAPQTRAEGPVRTAIRFAGPAGLKVAVQRPDGAFDGHGKSVERNFAQGQVYRLKVTTDAGGRFYPTLEVAPASPKTRVYLAHAAVPASFTADEFGAAQKGTFIVKVLYLPNPSDQDFSTVPDVEEVSSLRLEPGTDPVEEGGRRGTVIAVIRLGNIDLEPRDRTRPRSEER